MPDTGAPWNIPYVASGDLVRDWPTDAQELAEAVAAALDQLLEEIPVKKIARFTSSGTWTVPAGVTYAIAHMMGGGGGVGQSLTAGNGGTSSVAFAGGTVSAPGTPKVPGISVNPTRSVAGTANTGSSAMGFYQGASDGHAAYSNSGSPAFLVAGNTVTPAASITVTVGAGGAAGTGGAAGGSGYVYIEYYE